MIRPTSFLSVILLLSTASLPAETFPAANGLKRTLVTREKWLKDAVDLSVTPEGILFVTESPRSVDGGIDFSQLGAEGWIVRDLGLDSVEGKLAFYEEQLAENKKLSSDDLVVGSEKIRRLALSDSQGSGSEVQTFAEDFDTKATGPATSVLAWRGDLFATIAPNLWKLRDTTGDGRADQREVIASGFGVHPGLGEHEMQGLTMGPDGRLYWGVSDQGVVTTSQEGQKVEAPHEGAILRCYPDGSGLEVFARGLRNPRELAFDRYGNLFTIDLDGKPGEAKGRFLHITEGSDSGWRRYYRFLENYNPWLDEHISVTSGKFQPAYVTPAIENYSSGTAGLAFNPGSALVRRYRDSFFATEFPAGNLRSFKVRPKGATFDMTGDHVILSDVRAKGLAFGPDGALYSVAPEASEAGAIWQLDHPSASKSAERQEVRKLLASDLTPVATEELVSQLSHLDQRVRLNAQWELVARRAAPEFLRAALDSEAAEATVFHSLWGLAQLKTFEKELFDYLIKNDNPEFRAQAVNYASASQNEALPALEKALMDPSSRVRFMAATAIWKLEMSQSIDAVIAMLAENADRDAYLRHAGVLALSVSSAEEVAAKTLDHVNPSVRLAAAVAFRRLSSPLAAKLLQDENAEVVSEAARAIYDDQGIPSAYPALADLLRTDPTAYPAAIRRAIGANRHLADRESAIRLSRFAARIVAPEELRVAALEALASWTEGLELNLVDGRYEPLAVGKAEIVKRAYASVATTLQHHPVEAISAAAATVSQRLKMQPSVEDLALEIRDRQRDPAARIRSLAALASADGGLYRETLPLLLKDASPVIRAHAAARLAEFDPATVIAYAKQALGKSDNDSERQQAVATLAEMTDPAAKDLLKNVAGAAQRDPKRFAAILLEISEAVPESREALSEQVALRGGDARLGQQIYQEHRGARCASCHAMGQEKNELGPNLSEIGKQSRQYILQSLLQPQEVVTAGYGLMTVKTKDGGTLSGNFKEETGSSLTLILPGSGEMEIEQAQIESHSEPMSTMPASDTVLSQREIRDLVEYLAQQKGAN